VSLGQLPNTMSTEVRFPKRTMTVPPGTEDTLKRRSRTEQNLKNIKRRVSCVIPNEASPVIEDLSDGADTSSTCSEDNVLQDLTDPVEAVGKVQTPPAPLEDNVPPPVEAVGKVQAPQAPLEDNVPPKDEAQRGCQGYIERLGKLYANILVKKRGAVPSDQDFAPMETLIKNAPVRYQESLVTYFKTLKGDFAGLLEARPGVFSVLSSHFFEVRDTLYTSDSVDTLYVDLGIKTLREMAQTPPASGHKAVMPLVRRMEEEIRGILTRDFCLDMQSDKAKYTRKPALKSHAPPPPPVPSQRTTPPNHPTLRPVSPEQTIMHQRPPPFVFPQVSPHNQAPAPTSFLASGPPFKSPETPAQLLAEIRHTMEKFILQEVSSNIYLGALVDTEVGGVPMSYITRRSEWIHRIAPNILTSVREEIFVNALKTSEKVELFYSGNPMELYLRPRVKKTT